MTFRLRLRLREATDSLLRYSEFVLHNLPFYLPQSADYLL